MDCNEKKKRTKPKEEEYEFVPPDFDEREHSHITGTKIILVVSLLAVLTVRRIFIDKAWEWYGGMLLLILAIAGMKGS